MKIIENIAKWICRKLTREQVIRIIEVLNELLNDSNTKFKESKPEYPNYRKFQVDPEPPLDAFHKKELEIDYKEIIKNEAIKTIKHRGKNKPGKHIKCPHCGAPHNYIYVNNGDKKSTQYQCKVCKKTFCETPKISVSKYYCPICQKALYKWKSRLLVTMYKCGNDNCPRYLENKEKLSSVEKKLQKEKPSQFKLRYIYREYKINLKDIVTNELKSPLEKLDKFRCSLSTIGLVLTFHITLRHSTRETAFALRKIFGIKISHSTVARMAKAASTVCHHFNLKNIPKVPGGQAGDETYIKVKCKFHYVWFAIAKFRSIITAYKVSDNRGELSAVETLYMASEKHQKNENKDPLLFVADGNPSYQAAVTFLKKEGIDLDLKQVIGLENKDLISTTYRYLKNLVERVNRTYKHYAVNCFQNIEGASSHLAPVVTNYNFIRPHRSLNYQTPVALDKLKNIPLIQDVWAEILRSTT
jgi:transposase-like protein